MASLEQSGPLRMKPLGSSLQYLPLSPYLPPGAWQQLTLCRLVPRKYTQVCYNLTQFHQDEPLGSSPEVFSHTNPEKHT